MANGEHTLGAWTRLCPAARCSPTTTSACICRRVSRRSSRRCRSCRPPVPAARCLRHERRSGRATSSCCSRAGHKSRPSPSARSQLATTPRRARSPSPPPRTSSRARPPTRAASRSTCCSRDSAIHTPAATGRLVEAETGPGGTLEVGTGTVRILPHTRPSIGLTSVFNPGRPSPIHQETGPGQEAPVPYDLLLWGRDGSRLRVCRT